MKFYGGVQGGKRNQWLEFGFDQDDHVQCPIRNPAITTNHERILMKFT